MATVHTVEATNGNYGAAEAGEFVEKEMRLHGERTRYG